MTLALGCASFSTYRIFSSIAIVKRVSQVFGSEWPDPRRRPLKFLVPQYTANCMSPNGFTSWRPSITPQLDQYCKLPRISTYYTVSSTYSRCLKNTLGKLQNLLRLVRHSRKPQFSHSTIAAGTNFQCTTIAPSYCDSIFLAHVQSPKLWQRISDPVDT